MGAQVNQAQVAEDLQEDFQEGLEWAEAAEVLRVVVRGDARQYLVRWADSGQYPDSWELEEHLSPSLIAAWEAAQPKGPPPLPPLHTRTHAPPTPPRTGAIPLIYSSSLGLHVAFSDVLQNAHPSWSKRGGGPLCRMTNSVTVATEVTTSSVEHVHSPVTAGSLADRAAGLKRLPADCPVRNASTCKPLRPFIERRY